MEVPAVLFQTARALIVELPEPLTLPPPCGVTHCTPEPVLSNI